MQLAVKRVTLPELVARWRGGGGTGGGAGGGRGGGGGGAGATDNGENDENENKGEGGVQPPPRFDAAASIAGSHARSFYGVVNVEPDPIALANGWGLSPALLAYLRAVVRRRFF